MKQRPAWIKKLNKMSQGEKQIKEYVRALLESERRDLNEKIGLGDYWRRFKNALVGNPGKRAAMVFIEDLKKERNRIEVSSGLESLISQRAREYYEEEREYEDDSDAIFSQIFRQLRSDPLIRKAIADEIKAIDAPERTKDDTMEFAENYIEKVETHHRIMLSRKTTDKIREVCESLYPDVMERYGDKKMAHKAMFIILNKQFAKEFKNDKEKNLTRVPK